MLFAATIHLAQDQPPPRAAASSTIVVSPDEDYRIEPGDVVQVYVLQAPELSRDFRVNAAGAIELPFLGKVQAKKKTAGELSKDIADGLRGDYLVDPQVSAIVTQINRRFFIQGAVRSPGVYHVEGRPSLLELITIAGGLDAKYGSTAFIIRPRRTAAASGEEEVAPAVEYELQKANINAILRGEFSANAMIEPGDLVNIPPADMFFVAGEVKAPGSFQLGEGTTLRQAISLAQGTNPTAAPARAVIFREENGQKREVPVDVSAVMRGRDADVPIIANDIIVIPNSKAKSIFVPVINAFGVGTAYTASRIIP